DEQVLQLVREALERILAGEVLLRAGPAGNRVHDAPNELAHAGLTLRRPHRATEIFGNDDVGRLLRPRLRNLDVALLENDLALLVADDRRAGLPLHLVERVHAGQREVAREVETEGFGRCALRLLLCSRAGFAPSTVGCGLLAGGDGFASWAS